MRLTFRTSAYLRICLLFGSAMDDNHDAMTLRMSRPRYRRDHTIDALARGLQHSKRSSTTRMKAVPSHPQLSLIQKSPAAPRGETLRYVFAGMCCSVTALFVVPVVQARRSILALIFTLIILSRGAKGAKPLWKIYKPFARYAILANPMYIRANKLFPLTVGTLYYFGIKYGDPTIGEKNVG